MTNSTSQFTVCADATLEQVFDRADDLLGDVLDVDLQDGILTLETDSGGQFVLNKHEPNQQLWLSSPVSGASHYAYNEARTAWLSTRQDVDLLDQLAADLKALTGRAVSLRA